MSTTAASRRAKWHYPPPPPTPKILHLPRRPRRRPTKAPAGKLTSGEPRRDRTGKLETLFDQERRFGRNVPIVLFDYSGESERRREKVEISENGNPGGLVLEEEKWRFQAEMLRAECNLLRMEKDSLVKKLGRTRAKVERTLKSAVQTLVSGRIKIREGKIVDMVLEDEIQELTEKLQKLHRRSGFKDLEARKNGNLDRQVSVLQRRLEKIGGSSEEIYVREIQEMAETSLPLKKSGRVDDSIVSSRKFNVEILRMKMEGLSKGILLQRMEQEYNSMLSTASSSLASSASTSKRVELQDSSSSSRHLSREKACHEGNLCSGHCKAIVRRIVEHVRAETEQWSQMQEMLGQVREEMEELQTSRDFWEDRARNSDFQINSLNIAVQEWRERALSSEDKTNKLQAELSMLRGDLEMSRKEQNLDSQRNICSPNSSDMQNELEKRVLVCCMKENNHTIDNKQNEKLKDGERIVHPTVGSIMASKRSPFRDIGNTSLLIRQNGKAVFPLHCHLSK
ncbi:hypothetical protein L6164_029975 [Bauhinia variegata]|uniref:Uncharacterized protein n=1 Tax=Bauhinia variegata TaxID=167791 RepID=A0ACB9LBA3_BAUVA|nr:hypothetical protein L6164_029975 [Bauhinia variegata]